MISGTAINAEGRAMVGPMTPTWLRVVAVACAVALAGMTHRSAAQGGAEADAAAAAPEEPAEDDRPAAVPELEAGTPNAARATVLFLMPSMDAQTQSELRDALLAQFALIDADLVLEAGGSAVGPLSQRMADAQRRAAEHDAIAVFWIDGETDGRWFVHMMDIERERLVVRPADAAGDRRAAAVEAVAVMTRESARALIAGEPVPELAPEPTPIASEPQPAPVPTPVPPEVAQQGPLRLWAGYVGTDFAEELPWRHGAEAGVGWFGFAPIYAGASYVFTPALAVQSAVDFEVQRRPIAVHAGYRQRWDRAVLDVELGAVVEILHHSGLRADPGTTFKPKPAETAVTWALAPRLRGELTPVPDLGLFAALGLDILLNKFNYSVEQTSSEGTQLLPLLRADDVRPVLELGVAFYP
jgi:hypothetical protein